MPRLDRIWQNSGLRVQLGLQIRKLARVQWALCFIETCTPGLIFRQILIKAFSFTWMRIKKPEIVIILGQQCFRIEYDSYA